MTQLCRCGCGQPAPLATRTNRRLGHVKGHPLDYVSGHNKRGTADLSRWRLVDTGYATPCMLWTGPLTRKGYGRAHRNGVHHYAHRAAWLTLVGPLAAGEHLDHLCRQRACINIAHLDVVDAATNNRRASRLTSEDLALIRAASAADAAIAGQLGISRQYVSDLRRGRRGPRAAEEAEVRGQQ